MPQEGGVPLVGGPSVLDAEPDAELQPLPGKLHTAVHKIGTEVKPIVRLTLSLNQ